MRLSTVVLPLTFAVTCAGAECKLERFAELPVTMMGTRPVIAGSVNGVDALFIADSGAPFSTLTRDAGEKFKLRWEPVPNWLHVRGIKGGDVDVRLGIAKDFTLTGYGTGAVQHGVEFLVGGNAFGSGTAGVIGQNVIGRSDTEYDLGNGVIRLIHSRDCGNLALAYWSKDSAIAVVSIRETSTAEPQLIGTATLNGARIVIVFDTGASQSVLNFRGARRAGVKLDGPDVQAGGTLVGLRSDAIDSWITRFDSLDLGGEVIKNARLRIADIDLALGADMLLGADFFLSHRIYVASSQRKIYFTFNGGHVFDLRPAGESVPASAQPGDEGLPSTSAGFQRRGAALMGRGEIVRAIADFDRAIELDPSDPAGYSQRGRARWRSGDPARAMDDFDKALQLKPDEVPILIERGALRLSQNNESGAAADFDQATNLAPNDASVTLQIGEIFARHRHYAQAVVLYDRWAIAHPRDDRLAFVLGERCWVRALSGDNPDRAISDCNGALSNGQRTAHAFEGRGLVWLRLKNYDKAIADFKDSLRLESRDAYALYGLGVAELRKGMQVAGENDLKAAAALNASADDDFKRIGLAP